MFFFLVMLFSMNNFFPFPLAPWRAHLHWSSLATIKTRLLCCHNSIPLPLPGTSPVFLAQSLFLNLLLHLLPSNPFLLLLLLPNLYQHHMHHKWQHQRPTCWHHHSIHQHLASSQRHHCIRQSTQLFHHVSSGRTDRLATAAGNFSTAAGHTTQQTEPQQLVPHSNPWSTEPSDTQQLDPLPASHLAATPLLQPSSPIPDSHDDPPVATATSSNQGGPAYNFLGLSGSQYSSHGHPH